MSSQFTFYKAKQNKTKATTIKKLKKLKNEEREGEIIYAMVSTNIVILGCQFG